MRHILWTFLALVLAAPVMAQTAVQPPAATTDVPPREAVVFMRSVMEQVNPSLVIEDSHCATNLPWAIVQQTRAAKMDWMEVFVLAWQESNFDCHAKSKKDKGGAYGPFQIRRVWESLIGDPRVRYYDPDLAVKRVTKILRYYATSSRRDLLVQRQFRYPMLCLYNTGESRNVNMKYCKEVGRKMDAALKGWKDYQAGRLVAVR